mmetsp:Transcript_22301/g.25095  ORF Transcript_22301/g.25095 Transcript_22301/m.25095 type:complete len:137 (-) Transcript_22301:233-643(-)
MKVASFFIITVMLFSSIVSSNAVCNAAGCECSAPTGGECPSWWAAYYGPSIDRNGIPGGGLCCRVTAGQTKGGDEVINNTNNVGEGESVDNPCTGSKACPSTQPEEFPPSTYDSSASVISFEMSMISLAVLGLLLV